MNQELASTIKEMMQKHLDLSESDIESLEPDTPLMDSGLGLDSIDALELIVRVEKDFGIKIRNSEEARVAFTSFRSFVDFVESNLPPKS